MKNIRLIALTGVMLGAVSCSKEESCTVVFETGGGTPVPAAQRIEKGGRVSAPAVNPAKEDYVFAFWHLSGSTAAYDFQTPVNSDLTLHAKWQDEAEAEYWQVAWNLNGGSWPSGDNHATQVLKGGTLAEPAAPVKPDSTFEGWYKEPDLTGKVAFPYDVSGVTGNITLYAKWKTGGGGESTTFTIRNTADWNNALSAIRAGGHDKSYTLVIEGTVSVPPTRNVEQGKPSTYTFGGGDRLSVTLTGSGTLALSGPGFLMCLAGYVSDGYIKQKLIIDGPTLQGRHDNVVSLLRLDYADLELRNGKITGNTNNGGGGSGNGGGVCIKKGSLTMSGGEISDNTCGQEGYHADGGGVAISDGSFTMSGGTISGNTGMDGGGIYLYGYNFTMTGGTIKGNTSKSSSPYGGGVFYRRDKIVVGSFTKTGGIIYGYAPGDADSNRTVNNYTGNIEPNHGAAVLHLWGLVIPGDTKRRETTLGETDNLTSDSDTGWGL